MATVLIPDPVDLPQTAALRGLGRRGDICDVAWPQTDLKARFNGRYCRQAIPVPSADDDPAAFAEAILELSKSGIYDVVLPTRGSSLEALLPYAERLKALTNCLLPSESQFAVGIDKILTVGKCRDLRISHPDSTVLSIDTNIEEVAETYGYPVVVKHRRNFGGSIGVRMVGRSVELRPAIHDLLQFSKSIEDLIIQKFIPGTLFDVCVVAQKGIIKGAVTQARRLMYPISGGVAAILTTVDYPALNAKAEQVVRALNWNGPAQFEFKWDEARRTFSLIEINPRFWGTTGAWLKAGANFPALAVDLAMGRDVSAFPQLPPNLRFKYLVNRTPFALIQLWRAKGISALRDPLSYEHTWNDFDVFDSLPDLFRLYWETKEMVRGRRSLVDETLTAELIPSLSDSIVVPAA